MRPPMASGSPSVPPITPIRVIVGTLTGTIAEPMVALISEQPDMVLITQTQGAAELLMAVTSEVDVLVLSARQTTPLPGICSHLLGEFPDLRIVVLACLDDPVMVYWLGVRQQAL